MHLNWKRNLLPTLVATSFIGTTVIPITPAQADDKILRDLGIGAAAGVVSGAVLKDGSVINNAINGAAAGAAVNAAHGSRRGYKKKKRNLTQDVGVGALGGAASSIITNRRRPLNNAVKGAAAGAAIHILTK
ncbi:hypothetical protein [Calothrix sp. 336/3]|uniref:hypothetical protein n=1 Tax=Calothrix sp. 336/3 TaxID=1337936 RepID=UPI0004E3136A|nr:hypothetical protein [Calothrix sp. 336/3]AKG23287.1 hypothetical protein IJ00_20175 [Calothrix sp. 336/3]